MLHILEHALEHSLVGSIVLNGHLQVSLNHLWNTFCGNFHPLLVAYCTRHLGF